MLPVVAAVGYYYMFFVAASCSFFSSLFHTHLFPSSLSNNVAVLFFLNQDRSSSVSMVRRTQEAVRCEILLNFGRSRKISLYGSKYGT